MRLSWPSLCSETADPNSPEVGHLFWVSCGSSSHQSGQEDADTGGRGIPVEAQAYNLMRLSSGLCRHGLSSVHDIDTNFRPALLREAWLLERLRNLLNGSDPL